MEKLLKMLNEYEKENGRNFEVKKIGMTYRNNDLMVISKRYGFIKRLVDSNKIDRGKFEIEYTDKQTLKDVYIAGAKQDELLIMILSISDTPIEELLLYLK